jgi:dihydroorotase
MTETARGPVPEGVVLVRGARPMGAGPVDLLLRDGVVAEAVPTAAGGVAAPEGARVVEAAGLVALPGFVDLHVHLREPGRESAETIETGSRAAALGGFTSVHAMANTAPVADTASGVERVWRLGLRAGWTQVRPVGAVTIGLRGERLAELGAMADSEAQVRVFSDDGMCVHDPVLMRRALEYVKSFGGVVAQHAQEPRLTEGAQMNEGVVSSVLGLRGWPAVAEEAIIARDMLLADHVGSRLHLCHVSTAGSVELVRWGKSRGIAVTAEVTPHHLLLTDELVRGYDPRYKVNPPLRTARDVEALREGVADGTIDVIATDHAPHAVEDKDCEWPAAAMGMTGLETALSVVTRALVEPGHLDWAGVARVMSQTPATIGRVDGQGGALQVGEAANLVLVDPAARTAVDPGRHASRGRNSPFEGLELPGAVVATFFHGHPVVLDGALATSSTGQDGV